MPMTHDHGNYLLGMDAASLRRYQLVDAIYQPATAAAAAPLPMRPDRAILEIGCGIGETACWMAQQMSPKGHVTAFDQSAELVEAGRRLALERGIGNISFFCAKAQEVDLDPASFDLVHTRYVLTYSPLAAQIIVKSYDSLRPGGVFFGEEVSQIYAKHNAPAWFDQLTGWFAALISAGGGDPNYGIEQMPSNLLDAGFTELVISGVVPTQQQSHILEMLRLAMSQEMKQYIVDLGIAKADEIAAAIGGMATLDAGSMISSSMVIQVLCRK